MSDNSISHFKIEEQPLSPRTQQLTNYLEETWKQPCQPSETSLKRVTELLSQFPESYQTLGMTKIGEYFANSMSLHFLDLIATFQQKAESEGLEKEERVQTLSGVIPNLFTEMMEMSKQIRIRSLDDLVTCSNITFGLYTLSQAKTAEEAQDWMYELPSIYWDQLSQEHLSMN